MVGDSFVEARETIDGNTRVRIHGTTTFKIRNFRDFYGIYWETEMEALDYLEETATLTNDLKETTQKPSFVESSVTVGLENDKILEPDTIESVILGELQLSSILEYSGPEDQITHFRINTDSFNSSIEVPANKVSADKRSNRAGILSHKEPNEAMSRYCLRTVKHPCAKTAGRESLTSQITEIFKEHVITS